MDLQDIKDKVKMLDSMSFTVNPIKGKISDENYTKIGKIIGLFQRLEFSIKRNVSLHLGGNEKLNDCVIIELPFKSLIQSFRSLLIEKKEILSNEEDELIKQAQRVAEIRNRFVHSAWIGGEKNQNAISYKKLRNKNGLKHSFEQIQPTDFDIIIEWVDKLDTGFENLWWKEIKKMNQI